MTENIAHLQMSSTCTSPPLTRTLLPLCIQMFDAYVTKWSVVFIITLLSQQQTAASLLSGLPLEAFVDFFLFFLFHIFWMKEIHQDCLQREREPFPALQRCLIILSLGPGGPPDRNRRSVELFKTSGIIRVFSSLGLYVNLLLHVYIHTPHKHLFPP